MTATNLPATRDRICRLFEKRYPKLVEVLREGETDVLAYYGFPVEHRRQVWSTNSLERLNKEVSRRCDVSGTARLDLHHVTRHDLRACLTYSAV